MPRVQSNARRHVSARSVSSVPRTKEELLQGTAKGQQRLQEADRRTRDTAGERAAKRIKLQPADRPVNPTSSSSSSPSDAIGGGDAASGCNNVAGNVAQNAGNAVAGGVAQNAAQDTAMSGGANGRSTSPREKEDDEERGKRQRTEKKTEVDMEVSSVAKISDRRRILDFRRDGLELENINHRDAAMFSACELRPRVILTHCTKRTQHESTWDLCRAQGDMCANSSATSQRRTSRTAQGGMTRSSVKVCRAHQYQSSQTLTTSAAVC